MPCPPSGNDVPSGCCYLEPSKGGGGVGVATLVGEFMDLTKTSDRSPLCVIGGNSSPDLKSRVMHELTLACPSVELEEGIVASAATPVQEAFAIKCVLDSRRIDSFLVLTLDVTSCSLGYDGRYVDASACTVGRYGGKP